MLTWYVLCDRLFQSNDGKSEAWFRKRMAKDEDEAYRLFSFELVTCKRGGRDTNIHRVVVQYCDAWFTMKRQIHLMILIDGILVVIDSNIGHSPFPKRAKSSNEKRFVIRFPTKRGLKRLNDRSNRCYYF